MRKEYFRKEVKIWTKNEITMTATMTAIDRIIAIIIKTIAIITRIIVIITTNKIEIITNNKVQNAKNSRAVHGCFLCFSG